MPHEERSWMARWWRALVGEVLATALLMILGVGSMLPSPLAGEPEHPLTHPALGFGFVVTALIQAFGVTCGAHMNPSVTLAALIHKQIPLAPAAAYVVAQVVGALIGFGTLMLVSPTSTCAGVTGPGRGVTALGAAAVEALLTGTLALVAGGVWAAHDPARPDHAAPVKFGLTVAGLVYAGGKLTGASLNPARSLAPAALQGCWDAQWAYWVGPLGGAGLAALLQRYVLLPPAPHAPHAAPLPEELPLSDKPDH